MRKFLDIICILSFLISAGMAGGSFYMYKLVTSDEFKNKLMEQIKNEVMGTVMQSIPEVPKIDNEYQTIPFDKYYQ